MTGVLFPSFGVMGGIDIGGLKERRKWHSPVRRAGEDSRASIELITE